MYVIEPQTLPSSFSEADLEHLGACVCGTTQMELHAKEFGLGIEECKGCGLVRTNPRLKQSAIQRHYDEGFRNPEAMHFTSIVDRDRDDPPHFQWRDASNRYRWVAKKLRALFPANGAPPKLLEIGFGGGEFARELKAAGFDVHGFDVAQSSVEKLRANGFGATHAPSLPEAKFPESSFDVVVMWEVFEHIPNPDVFAAEIHRILKPNGYWFLQVPNWRWLKLKMQVTQRIPGRKKYLSKYGVIGPLFHLYHHTHEALKRTLEPRGFRHKKSYRIRLYDENRWQALVAHELLYLIDSIPALLTGNRRHWNVILVELYQVVK